MNVSKKIFKGSVYRTISTIITMLMAFMLLPVIVKSLGNEYYGIWVIIAALGGYYGALDFGMSSAVVRFVSKYIDNKELVNKYMCTSFYMFVLISCLVIIVSILISLNLSNIGLYNYDNSLIQVVIIISGLSTAAGFLSKSSVGLITSFLKYDTLSIVQLSISIIRSLATYVFLTNGGGLFELALVLLVSSTIESICLLYVSFKISRADFLNFIYFDFLLVKGMFHYAKYTFIAQVSDILRNYAFPVLIAAVIDIKSVASFAIAMRVWSMIGSLCSSMLSVFTPVFSQMDSQRDKLESLYNNALKFSNYLGLYFCILILILLKPLLIFWLGIEIASEVYPICLILSVSTMSSISQMPTVNLLYGLSYNKQYAITNLAQGLISLTLAYVAAQYYAISGVAISIAITGAIIKLFVQPRYAVNALKLNPFNYYINQLKLLIVPFFYGLIIYVYSNVFLFESLYSVIIFSFLVTLTYFMAVYLFHLNATERKLILNLGKSA